MRADLSDELSAVVTCDRMRWTYQELGSQPQWLVKGLHMLWNARAEAGKG